MSDKTTHPLAIGPNAEPGRSGGNGMRSGDRVEHRDGRKGVAVEFLSDGDALVTWDNGSHGVVRWGAIKPEDAVWL